MSDKDLERDPSIAPDPTGEDRLRGKTLIGPEQKRAVDHIPYEKMHDPDAVLHLDDEKDTLYNDGLDLDDDPGLLAGTDGNPNKG